MWAMFSVSINVHYGFDTPHVYYNSRWVFLFTASAYSSNSLFCAKHEMCPEFQGQFYVRHGPGIRPRVILLNL